MMTADRSLPTDGSLDQAGEWVLDAPGTECPRALAKEFNALALASQSLLLVVPAVASRGSGGLIDSLEEQGFVGDLHVVIELLAPEQGPFGDVLNSLNAAFDTDTDLAGHAGLASVCVGVVMCPNNIRTLGEVFERCVCRGIPVRFRLADSLEEYSQADRYHLVEFLEGVLAYGDPSDAERRAHRVLIDVLLNGRHDPSMLPPGPEVIRVRLAAGKVQRVAEDRFLAADQRPPLTSWGDIFRFEGVGNDAAGAASSALLHPRIRTLTLAAARKLGIESAARRSVRWCLAPYRRSVSGRRFRQRVGRIVAGMNGGAVWPEQRHGRRILICGWYGTETLGDKAILAGILQSLESALGDLQSVLVSLHPYVSEMTRAQMPELAEIDIVKPMQGVELARSADLVVFGGGPLMALGVLADMQAIFEVAKKNGVATLIGGCGVGPLGEEWHNRSIRRILELGDLRIYRDTRSRELATGLGVDTHADVVAEDPAFSWLLSLARRDNDDADPDRPVLLLGLRDFPYRAYARHLDEDSCRAAKLQYEQAVVEALEILAARNSDLLIRPLPMCTNHFGGDDRWFYRRLFRQCPGLAARLDTSLLGIELPPADYCRAFQQARAALVMRFHSLVFALGLDVPAVAIDYTLGRGKVHALATRFGVPQRSLDELSAEFLVKELQTLIDKPQPQRPGWTPEFAAVIQAQVPALLKKQEP